MYKNLLSVGGLTLLSRGTGFLRDVLFAAAFGSGLIAEAYLVAFRLPNHFRTIFGEGAFSAAYVPCYAQVLESQGKEEAGRFCSQVAALLLTSQIVVLILAWIYMPTLVDWLAPGFRDDPEKFSLTVTLTRITFPYLLFITLVTLQSGTLNAHGRFVAAACTPILMNLTMIATFAIAMHFSNPGVVAALGITLSGVLQYLLTAGAAYRLGILESPTWPKLTKNVRHFLLTLGPAVIGSAGVQIALFADTIIASLLPGGIASITYADRLYQLPVGIIGIAAGTVLLPEMSRLRAAGKPEAALHAQNRTMALTIALSAPFCIAFLTIPDLIMRGVFLRGAFTSADAAASARVLAAYGLGLMAIVLIRSALASFQAEADTKTPMIVSLIAVASNVCLKLVLFEPLGAAGLATATAAGAWINLTLLFLLATRRGTMQPDRLLWKTVACVSAASLALALFARLAMEPVVAWSAGLPFLRNETALIGLSLAGALLYGAIVFAGLRFAGVSLKLRRR
ncbi:murein biosynthesis integral membrane protein MurJ [Beijerinckia indica]|uniref:Probable lipid II flippase MurJ n=1 Tax=Beijerinckia indica subsp. indica (strain ATCC 9039 / DSM 1715 / NCIMB 8712) TaxID=395963 RepID=B2IC27_BEII9|nr:murein biosynthesis integral membrane protein MurJ [Beijerinckia indica]ACB95282.1 integral membrane protein MviN [Beijerinckia indica subsp. indica ATCC 9039]